MQKGLFLSLPSVSVSKTLTPVIEEIASGDYELIYYNSDYFIPEGQHNFSVRKYPASYCGYHTGPINEDTSYFNFAEMLVDTASSIIQFLIDEVEKEKPDFIIHSHLALWGKLVAEYFGLPAISLFTTHVLDARIMIPHLRETKKSHAPTDKGIKEAMNLIRKYYELYRMIKFPGKPDIWDAYVNKEPLNLVFILKEFQPHANLFGSDFRFLGYPFKISKTVFIKKVIYLSLGTVFNGDISLVRLCIRVFGRTDYPCIISLGKKVDRGDLGELPSNVSVFDFVDQESVLGESLVFLTRGGMASVQEAVYTLTPMIIIPGIPEQQLTAVKVEELGIGIHLQASDLSEDILYANIVDILRNHSHYQENLKRLMECSPETPASKLAHQYVTNYLNQ